LLASYGGGDAPVRFREIFGLDFLGDDGPRAQLVCRGTQPGVLGEVASFEAAVPVGAYARTSAAGATIAATDQSGTPLATLHRFGRGRAAFLAVPAERILAAHDPWSVPEEFTGMVRGLYASMAEAAGCGPLIDCDRAEVEVGLFSGEDDDVVVLINHGSSTLAATVSVCQRLTAFEDLVMRQVQSVDADSFSVSLPAYGVAVLRLVYGVGEEVR
jgi:hypothetical protein